MVQDALAGAQRLVHQDTAHRVGQGKGQLVRLGMVQADGQAALRVPVDQQHFFPACASPIPRFAQVVVLPTPPFWLVMAMICVFNDFTSFLIGVVMCLHSSPGNDKSRHLKQVTASPKSNILLCLKSKGFEFLSAIHLSLMKHLL